MKRGQQLNRIPVHDIGLNSVDENDTVAHSEEFHKTSSILSGDLSLLSFLVLDILFLSFKIDNLYA